jgi:hypothetical protein
MVSFLGGSVGQEVTTIAQQLHNSRPAFECCAQNFSNHVLVFSISLRNSRRNKPYLQHDVCGGVSGKIMFDFIFHDVRR